MTLVRVLPPEKYDEIMELKHRMLDKKTMEKPAGEHNHGSHEGSDSPNRR